MADFKIGSYTIQTQKAYEALLKAGITSDDRLKKLDKNKDSVLSEDELQEAVLEDDDATTDTENGNKSDSSDGSSEEDTTASQLMAYESQLNDLQEQLNQQYSRLAQAKDLDDTKSTMEQIQNLQKQMQQTRNQIFNILYKAENSDGSAGGTGSLGAGGNTSSKTANYALQYDGKSASEMRKIMQDAGCRFDEGAWCADFVTFASKMANGGTCPNDFESCPNTASCPTIANWASEKGLYTTDISKVQPGDFVLYGSRGSEYHIGIVTAVNDDGTIDTIEGNTSDDNGNYTNGVVNQHSHVSKFGGFVIMH